MEHQTRVSFKNKSVLTHVLGKDATLLPQLDSSHNTQSQLQGLVLTITGENSVVLASHIEDLTQTYTRTDLTNVLIKPRTPGQETYQRILAAHELCFGIGPAGTGKTLLAVAAMVERYKNKQIEKLILSRPAVEAGEKIGFLPGDQKEKVDPYMQPLYESLAKFFTQKQLSMMMESKEIEIAPIGFLRGRTLANAGVLIDEAQNLSVMQMKMVLTRLGEGSYMAVTGDINQIDIPQESGLKHAREKLKDVKGIGWGTLTHQDVVRHPLVGRILKAYGDT